MTEAADVARGGTFQWNGANYTVLGIRRVDGIRGRHVLVHKEATGTKHLFNPTMEVLPMIAPATEPVAAEDLIEGDVVYEAPSWLCKTGRVSTVASVVAYIGDELEDGSVESNVRITFTDGATRASAADEKIEVVS